MAIAPIAIDTLGSDCPILLYQLDNYLCTAPVSKRSRLALLGNMGIFASPFYNQFNALRPELVGTGKIKQVRLQYLQRECVSNLDDCATVDSCTAGTTDPYQEELVDFTPVCSVKKFTVSMNDFQRTCTGVNQGILERMMMQINALALDHEQKLTAQIIAGAGGNAEGPVLAGNYRTINAVINENGLINANAIHTLNEDLLMNEADDCTVVAIGGLKTALGKVDTVRQIGCCNDVGVDQQAAADALGFGFFKSKAIEAAFTGAGATNPATSVALMHPGSVQYIDWYQYDGDGAYTSGLSTGTTFTDPVSGIKFDMKVEFITCPDPVYVITLSKQSMAYTMPTTLYRACDDLTTVNGIWLYDLLQCDPVECPVVV